LYLGAWILIAGAALLFLFTSIDCPASARLRRSAVAALTGWQGLSLWKKRTAPQRHRASSYSLSPDSIALLVAMGEYHIREIVAANPDWELLTTSPDNSKKLPTFNYGGPWRSRCPRTFGFASTPARLLFPSSPQ